MNNNQIRESSEINDDFLQIQIKQMLYRIQKQQQSKIESRKWQTLSIMYPESER